jgi:Zn-dependent protease
MGSGLSFRLFGIPVRIDPSFLVITVMWGLGERSTALIASWIVVVTLSILAHELGHAITYRIFDRRPNIVLQWLGGVTFAEGGLTPARSLIVSLAGPLTGLLLIGLPALVIGHGALDGTSTWASVLNQVVWVNIVWSVFNLLPVLPLDGGQVTAAALHFAVGPRNMRITHMISAAIAGVGIAYGITHPAYIFVGLFAGFLGWWNINQLKGARPQEDQAEILAGYRAISRGDPAGASARAERVIGSGPADHILAAAVEMQAWARVSAGDATGARASLSALPEGFTANRFLVGCIALVEGRRQDALDELAAGFRAVQFGPWSTVVAEMVCRAGLVEPLLDRLSADDQVTPGALVQLQSHLHFAGRRREAALAGERAIVRAPADPAEVAYNVACDWALAGQPDLALTWLGRAVASGFSDRRQMDADPDLASLRTDPRYATLVARLPIAGAGAAPGATTS